MVWVQSKRLQHIYTRYHAWADQQAYCAIDSLDSTFDAEPSDNASDEARREWEARWDGIRDEWHEAIEAEHGRLLSLPPLEVPAPAAVAEAVISARRALQARRVTTRPGWTSWTSRSAAGASGSEANCHRSAPSGPT